MDNKNLLFSYYLHKLAQKEQELLRCDDFRIGLFAAIFANTRLFRRYASGCTVEPICFCNPIFAQDLFIYLCINAQENGDNLFKEFNFRQITGSYFHYPLCAGRYPCIEDRSISSFLDRLYPSVLSEKDVDVPLLEKLQNLIGEQDLEKKFRITSNIRQVRQSVLPTLRICAETEMIDRAFERLAADDVMCNMLSIESKCDINGVSVAYTVIKTHLNYFPHEV